MVMAFQRHKNISGEDGVKFRVCTLGDEHLHYYEDTSNNVITLDENNQPYYTEYKEGQFIRKEKFNKETRKKHLTKDFPINGDTSNTKIEKREVFFSPYNNIEQKTNIFINRPPLVLEGENSNYPSDEELDSLVPIEDLNYDNYFENPSIFINCLIIHAHYNGNNFPYPPVSNEYIESFFSDDTKFSTFANYWKQATKNMVKTNLIDIIEITVDRNMPDGSKNVEIFAEMEKEILDMVVSENLFDFSPYEKYSEKLGYNKINKEDLNIIILLDGLEASASNLEKIDDPLQNYGNIWGHAEVDLSDELSKEEFENEKNFFEWKTPSGASLYHLAMFGTIYRIIDEKINSVIIDNTFIKYFDCSLISHEIGHSRFNFPDLYGTTAFGSLGGTGVGLFCLMGAGCWGTSIPFDAEKSGNWMYDHYKYIGNSPVYMCPYTIEKIHPDLIKNINYNGKYKMDYIIPTKMVDKIDENKIFYIKKFIVNKSFHNHYDNGISGMVNDLDSFLIKAYIIFKRNILNDRVVGKVTFREGDLLNVSVVLNNSIKTLSQTLSYYSPYVYFGIDKLVYSPNSFPYTLSPRSSNISTVDLSISDISIIFSRYNIIYDCELKFNSNKLDNYYDQKNFYGFKRY